MASDAWSSGGQVRRRHVVVVVLGDVGRSPRMQYHCLSLLEHGHCVSLVGYRGEDLISSLQQHVASQRSERGDMPSLGVVRFEAASVPEALRSVKALYLALRLASLCWSLAFALWVGVPREQKRLGTKRPVDCLLVQNPPSTPLLLMAYLYCHLRRRRAGLVIDWHNLGHSMLDLPPSHVVRRLAFNHERFMAPLADAHLTVTAAMKAWLLHNFKLPHARTQVLHDRPPDFFRPTDIRTEHELMRSLATEFETQCPRLLSHFRVHESDTLFTRLVLHNGQQTPVQRTDRPALLISSTSWTPDEDFSILFQSLVQLDHHISHTDDDDDNHPTFPKVLVVVTGKGPQKQMYQRKISQLDLNHVFIVTLWLTSADYPKLLGCADLGISLHTSTSGLDLPMKILDMFGSQVPVCAIHFSCLHELVQDGINGTIFHTSQDLTRQLIELLGTLLHDEELPTTNEGSLERLTLGVKHMTRWRENWNEHAHPTILNACPSYHPSSIHTEADHNTSKHQ